MWKLASTFSAPAQGANAQRGFPAPGTGAQTTGGPSQPAGARSVTPYAPVYPTKGNRSWTDPAAPVSEQRGFAAALSWLQRRPAGSMPARQAPFGTNLAVYTPYYSRGAAAYVQNYGKILENPIGAGVVATRRIQAQNTQPGQYVQGAIFWTSQSIPTSVNLQGLTDPSELAAYLDPITLEAMVRTTG